MTKGYPTLAQAEQLWQESVDLHRQNYPEWIDAYIAHTRGVAEAAKTIAEHCPDLNPEKAYVLGLLHDYGKKYNEWTTGLFHGRTGYEDMLKMGYPDVAKICLTHSFPRQQFRDIDYISYHQDWRKWAHQELAKVTYDDYDRLIQLCDMFFEGTEKVDCATRFAGIIKRYNLDPDVFAVLQEDTERNKAYFDRKTGCDIYQLLGIRSRK